jgi:hypothetical protein
VTRPPLDATAARALVVDAIARSPARASYGAELTLTATTEGELTFTAEGGATITVDRHGGELRRGGRDTARIDWLYRLHYLQWTGHPTVDRALAVVGLALTWAAMLAGLWLAIRRWRRRA